MHHVRTVLLAVLANVGHVKTLGQIEVELNRRRLPFAAQGVLDLQVNLGAIESAAAFVDFAVNAFGADGFFQRHQSLSPHPVIANRLFWAGG